jgi:hypothetical protein
VCVVRRERFQHVQDGCDAIDVSNDGSRVAYLANGRLHILELETWRNEVVDGRRSERIPHGLRFSPTGHFSAGNGTGDVFQSLRVPGATQRR